ncbi:MAG TPA: hypothetical protein VKE69_09035 [Planctomycetota bacterium]|nr:hypothetical protein [Planctomycetota bacterium]
MSYATAALTSERERPRRSRMLGEEIDWDAAPVQYVKNLYTGPQGGHSFNWTASNPLLWVAGFAALLGVAALARRRR